MRCTFYSIVIRASFLGERRPQSTIHGAVVHMLGVATLQQFLIINFEALPFNKKKKSELKHQQQQPLPILIVNALPECELAHQHSNGM